MNFQKNLMYLRRRRGMTQQDLADKMGTTRNQISRWETGARVPDLNDIILLRRGPFFVYSSFRFRPSFGGRGMPDSRQLMLFMARSIRRV